jgi:hypothetical protein
MVCCLLLSIPGHRLSGFWMRSKIWYVRTVGFFFGFVLVPMCFLEYCSSSFVLVLERIQGIAISALANCEHAMLCDSGIHDRVLLCIGWWLQVCSENCSKYFIVGTSETMARHVWLLLTTSFIRNMMSDTSWVRHVRLWVHSFLSGFYLLVWLELKWWL